MVNEAFCIACQAMLATRDVPESSDDGVPHHPDGQSFRQALDSGCRICVQFWYDLKEPDQLHRTTWEAGRNPSSSDSSQSITFFHYGQTRTIGYLDLKPWIDDRVTNDSNILLSDNTGSEQSFEFLNSKYKQCRVNHSVCYKAAPHSSLPLRLLDVGSVEHHTIRLVEQEHVPPLSAYVALSHCWGGFQPFMLTSSTNIALRTGVADTQLPKTFQQAVAVTRQLQIQYIWIDSLCIFQDDLDDWSIQAATMQDDYQFAALTIAATAAPNGSFGLFQHRDPELLAPFKVEVAWFQSSPTASGEASTFRTYLCYRDVPTRHAIDEAPLNRRAWVMQERQLSRRIAHYTSKVVYWECQESFANEFHPDGLPAMEMKNSNSDTRLLKRLLDSHDFIGQRGEQREALYKAWNLFLWGYTHCQITYKKDTLVALAGIVQRVSQALEDNLVAGLWQTRFIQQLCWYTSRPDDIDEPSQDNKPWFAPTWSWVSVDDDVIQGGPATLVEGREVAELVELTVHARQSGELTHGFAKIRCRPLSALLRFEQTNGHWINRTMFSTEDVTQVGKRMSEGGLWLDRPCFTDAARTVNEFHLLLLQDGKHAFFPGQKMAAGIAVVPSATQTGAYERIGFFSGKYKTDAPRESFYGELVKRHERADDQIIKII